MKLLLVSASVFGQGGVEKVFCEMANALAERGHNVSTIIWAPEEGEPFYKLSDKVKQYVPGRGYNESFSLYHRIRRLLVFDKVRRHAFDEDAHDDPKLAKILKPIIEAECPEVIVAFHPKVTRTLIRQLQCPFPIVTMFHGAPEIMLPEMSEHTKSALTKSACVQVLMPSFADTYQRHLQLKRVEVIPNIVPSFSVVDDAAYSQRKIISMGRVSRQKQQLLLLEALGYLGDRWKQSGWQLDIYGDQHGERFYYEQCIDMVKKFDLHDTVFFHEPTHEVEKVLRTASVYVQPSAFEGFGLSMGEAMSIGLPVLAYRSCPALNELVVHDANGLLCDDGTEALGEALLKLMNDQKLRQRLGHKAHEDMQAYKSDIIWDKWEKLLESVR